MKLVKGANNRTAQSLHFSLRPLTEKDLRSVLTIVPVTKLTVEHVTAAILAELVSVLGTIVGNTVRELVLVTCTNQQHLVALLSNCPNLKSVKFEEYEAQNVLFTSDVVTVLSNFCRQLEHLEIGDITPTDFVNLLANCRELTDVKLGHVWITAPMLQAVVDGGTVRTLRWRKRPLLQEESMLLAAFSKLAIEKQMIPVPRLLMYF